MTSDQRVMPCSFHHTALPARTAGEILAIWRDRQDLLATPSRLPGCARLADFGLAPITLGRTS